MTGLSVLDQCRTLLDELDQVERRLSRLTGNIVDSAAKSEDEISQIEGLIDSHADTAEEFAALRAKIVGLGRSYGLCPQHVPDEGYSSSGLRGLLQGIQKMEQGFKQPAPEPLDALCDNIPSDLLDSLEAPIQRAAELVTEFRTAGERLPSDVERFLDRVISEANQAALEEPKLSGAITASLPITSVPQRVPATHRQEQQKPVPAPKAFPQPGQAAPQHSQASEKPKTVAPSAKGVPVEAPTLVPEKPERESTPATEEARPSEASAPPSVSVPFPSVIVEAASAAEGVAAAAAAGAQVRQEAPTRDWKPSSMASDRDYQDLLEYGEGKLGLGRPEFADLLANLALLNHKLGRYGDSEELHRKELMIRENELGADHPKVATSLNNLALLFRDLGRREEARALWERSLAIVEEAFGSDHPKVALRLSNLADLLQDCGETAAAERYYQRLMKLRETGNAVKKREVRSSLRRYAKLLRSSRRRREARQVEAQVVTSRPGWLPKWR